MLHLHDTLPFHNHCIRPSLFTDSLRFNGCVIIGHYCVLWNLWAGLCRSPPLEPYHSRPEMLVKKDKPAICGHFLSLLSGFRGGRHLPEPKPWSHIGGLELGLHAWSYIL